jgi:hypothetical protein
MPNYVENILKLYGKKEDIAKLLAHVKTDKNVFDFNTLIPMPESLDIISGSSTEISLAVYIYKHTGMVSPLLTKRHQEYCQELEEVTLPEYVERLLQCGGADFSLGETAYNNKKKYGATDWYDWCIWQWGCKWNSVEPVVEDEQEIVHIWFQTAWNAPNPVVDKLAELFPDVEISHLWADEDIGYTCGEVYYSCEGKCESDVYDESNEAYKIYLECWGEDNCIGQDDDGNYFRKSCDTCTDCA